MAKLYSVCDCGANSKQCTNFRTSFILLFLTLVLNLHVHTEVLEKVNVGMSKPCISPDGRTILFECLSSIWIVSVEGGEATRLALSADRAFSPTWSRDGKYIACVTTDGEYRSFAIQILGRGPTDPAKELWRTSHEIKGTLDWSPSGEEIAVSLGPNEELFLLSTKGGEPRPLHFKGIHPRWSPDGTFLAFQTAENRDLWIAFTMDWKLLRLATAISANGSFCWSPDGKAIVYESLDRQSLDLWKVAVTGGRAILLTTDIALEQGPSWHPTNGHVYFSHRRRIWRVDSAGGPMEPILITCKFPKKPDSKNLLAFKDADVVDIVTGKILPKQTILVQGSRIEAIGPRLSPPSSAKIFDMAGKVAVPGLMDMHVHYLPWMAPYFLRYGITRILELGSILGLDGILSLGDEIKAGRMKGPILYQSGMVLNGSGIPGPPGLGGIQSLNPELMRKALEWLLDEGIDVVKIGSENTRETLQVILELAHQKQRRVYGHISLIPAEEAIKLGQDGIEHPRGLGWANLLPKQRPEPVPRGYQGMLRESSAWRDAVRPRSRDLTDLMIKHGVVWDPTLYVWDLMSTPEGLTKEPDYDGLPEWVKEELREESQSGFRGTWLKSDYEAFGAGLPAIREMVSEFYEGGGMLTAGSDGGIPGISLHHELEQFRLSGLSPLDCLRAATLNSAKSLRREAEIGSLESGKLADIIFIQRNPLQDIQALKEIVMTVQQGKIVYLKDGITAK